MARKGRRQANHHGYLVIDKPSGWTSHDVVARVRKIVNESRVGHAGTLDPMATGVLPVAIGLATRTVEYLANADKAYRATLRFGVTTDSADVDGDVIATCDPSALTLTDIQVALESFRGEILQRPPMHSAIRINGQRLYDLARKGQEIEIEPRRITIPAMEIVQWQSPDLTLDITCSKGTYIRAIARDLGEVLGVGAHLTALQRTRTGTFLLADAVSLDDLDSRFQESSWADIAAPADSVIAHLPSVTMDDLESIHWYQGKVLNVNEPAWAGAAVRTYDVHGHWRGIGRMDDTGQTLQPVKVIPVEL